MNYIFTKFRAYALNLNLDLYCREDIRGIHICHIDVFYSFRLDCGLRQFRLCCLCNQDFRFLKIGTDYVELVQLASFKVLFKKFNLVIVSSDHKSKRISALDEL